MKCCGKERDSKFCPDCGESLHQDPLWDLVEHCLTVSQRLKSNASTLRAKGCESSATTEHVKKIDSFEVESQKWHAWATALEARLSGDQSQMAPNG